mmetsp:Transcript_122364/g.182836  ORF Transcript_122364/g.182836 Transcript_122364/m.182836 type:complete len:228 (-) Transcript_122364:1240-1923(-)
MCLALSLAVSIVTWASDEFPPAFSNLTETAMAFKNEAGSRQSSGVMACTKERLGTLCLSLSPDTSPSFFPSSLVIVPRISASIAICKAVSSSSRRLKINVTSPVCPVKRQLRGRARILSATPLPRQYDDILGERNNRISSNNVAWITPGGGDEAESPTIWMQRSMQDSARSVGSSGKYAGTDLKKESSCGGVEADFSAESALVLLSKDVFSSPSILFDSPRPPSPTP